MENRNFFPIIYTRKSFVPYRNCPKEYTICSISVFRETQPPLRTSADLGVPRFGLCPTARSRQTQRRNAQDVTALSLFSLLCVLRDHGPVHVDAVAEDVPLRHVAAGVVPQHTGRILADQQVVLRVAVVIPCPDHEPVVGVELAASYHASMRNSCNWSSPLIPLSPRHRLAPDPGLRPSPARRAGELMPPPHCSPSPAPVPARAPAHHAGAVSGSRPCIRH